MTPSKNILFCYYKMNGNEKQNIFIYLISIIFLNIYISTYTMHEGFFKNKKKNKNKKKKKKKKKGNPFANIGGGGKKKKKSDPLTAIKNTIENLIYTLPLKIIKAIIGFIPIQQIKHFFNNALFCDCRNISDQTEKQNCKNKCPDKSDMKRNFEYVMITLIKCLILFMVVYLVMPPMLYMIVTFVVVGGISNFIKIIPNYLYRFFMGNTTDEMVENTVKKVV